VKHVDDRFVSIPEAVRRTGVGGDVIFLAIRHGELDHELDDRGFPRVDPDEVARLEAAR
jgi:hypothetical protein